MTKQELLGIKKSYEKLKFDLEKFKKAHVYVYGKVNTKERLEAIEDAIKILQEKPEYFNENYIGIKNYAHFGDQRHDARNGLGPKHGVIVFRISSASRNKDTTLHIEESIYALLAARDYGDKGSLIARLCDYNSAQSKVKSCLESFDFEVEL